MSAPPLTPPPRPVVTPGQCEALRNGDKCGEPGRLYAAGWRCGPCAPGAPPPLPPAQAA